MTGKEIADVCRKHNSCENCELIDFRGCNRMNYDMEHANPCDIYDILEREYGKMISNNEQISREKEGGHGIERK